MTVRIFKTSLSQTGKMMDRGVDSGNGAKARKCGSCGITSSVRTYFGLSLNTVSKRFLKKTDNLLA
jgi:hypothetical protein